MSQTSYANQGSGYKGQVEDLGNTDIVSKLAEEAVEFGDFVVVGTDLDRQAKKPAVGTDITSAKATLGVVVRTHTVENPISGNAGEHAVGDMISVMKKGRVKVEVQTAFDPSDSVYVGFQNGEEGQFFNANSADREELVNARFTNTGIANELAVLDLSLV